MQIPPILSPIPILVCALLLIQAPANSKTVESVSMPVFYVTDRQRDGGNLNPTYNCKRRYAEGVEYGQCQVITPTKVNPKDYFKLGWRGQSLKRNKANVSSTKSEYRQPKEFFEDLSSRLNASDKVILFVHGYNNSMDVAMQRAAELGLSCRAPVIAYCWPSNEKTLSYIKDECNAEWSLMHFRNFLTSLEGAVGGASKVMIVSHSMGNRLVMWALNARAELNQAKGTSASKFCDLVMTSPDIDSGTFRNYANNVCSNADETWVLISRRDKALFASKRVHGRDRLGSSTEDNVDIDWRQPPKIVGLKTIEFTSIDKGFIGHSVRPELISRVAQSGVQKRENDPIEFIEETDGDYTWYRVLSEREKRTKKKN